MRGLLCAPTFGQQAGVHLGNSIKNGRQGLVVIFDGNGIHSATYKWKIQHRCYGTCPLVALIKEHWEPVREHQWVCGVWWVVVCGGLWCVVGCGVWWVVVRGWLALLCTPAYRSRVKCCTMEMSLCSSMVVHGYVATLSRRASHQ